MTREGGARPVWPEPRLLYPSRVSPRAHLLPDERDVVARAQRGDRRAFAQIYRAYARTLHGYVLVPMLGDGDDAEDCLRETFIAAHRALASYAWRDSGIYGWLKVLAKNKARDLLRASGRRQRLRGAFAGHVDALGGGGASTAGEEEIQRTQLRERIEEVLEDLNPRYATVLRMRLLEDRSREECAQVLDVKIGTLDVLLFRACKSFRQACEKHGVAFGGEL
jgi:RNA polymerase sigma-70 factor (ECF subfamily)